MAAGTLSKLGIYMGDQLSSRYQDQEILDCINKNDKARAKKIIKERNEKYQIWGVKKLRLWRWDQLFREPVYVVIFRDLFAVANRRVSLFNTPLLSELFNVIRLNFLLILFLRLTKRPVFVASYEKALLYPEDFVKGISEFIGIDAKEEKFNDAIQFINPSPSEYTTSPVNYRSVSKSRKIVGYIDKITTDSVTGWALSKDSQAPLRLELLVNGNRMQNTVANLPRPDVASADPGFHANCGFIFRLADKNALKTGDQIDICIEGADEGLINSPQKFV